MVEQQTPEARAEAVARELADTGRAVTARAVREGAGVRMTVAASVAKAWNEATAEADTVPVPEVPTDVHGRFEAIWADAYRSAWDAVSPERDRLQAEVEQLTKDAEAYRADLHEAEQTEQSLRDELDQANQRATEAEAQARTAVEQAQHETAEIRGRADQLATENERLTKFIDEQLAKLTNHR